MLRSRILVAVGSACLLFGCGKSRKKPAPPKPSCARFYAQLKKCDKMPLSKGGFLEICRQQKANPGFAAQLACSTKGSCADFKACSRAAESRVKATEVRERFAKAMKKAAKGQWSDAMTVCEVWKKDLDEDTRSKCAGLAAKATAVLTRELTAMRDQGRFGDVQTKCWDLKKYAQRVGTKDHKGATTLCREIELAKAIIAARKGVEIQLKDDLPLLPHHCEDAAIARADAVGTDFARKVKAELLTLCFKRLGARILRINVPKMTILCLPSVRRLYKAILRHKVTDPALAPWMAKARAKCAAR